MGVTEVLMVAGALLFPVAGLLFLLWLARLEDTLPRAVRSTQRRPAPPPVLAVPVRRRPEPATTVRIPQQRTPESVPVVPLAVPEVA